MQNSDGYYI